jgi:hypothetical protein
MTTASERTKAAERRRGATATEYILIAAAVVLAFSLLHGAHCAQSGSGCRPPLERLSGSLSEAFSITSLLLQLPL